MKELYRWFLFAIIIFLGVPLILAALPLIGVAILIERTGFWGEHE